jgi:hypothetical protein
MGINKGTQAKGLGVHREGQSASLMREDAEAKNERKQDGNL